MILSLKISRLSNFLFFAKNINRNNLIKFDLEKYLSYENIDLSFYGSNDGEIWQQIEKSIGKQNAKKFQKNLVLLKPTFVSYWNKKFKQLISWEKYFQNNQVLFQQVISEIEKLCGIKKLKKFSSIPIYLISDPLHNDKEIQAWFSWSPQKRFIVVEIPTDFEVSNNLFPLCVLLHEFFHLIIRENKKLNLEINKIAEKNKKMIEKISNGMPARMFLEELFISSFIPEGYFGKKYFYAKTYTNITKPKNLLMWRIFIAHKLIKTEQKYVNFHRQINGEYFEKIIELIKEKSPSS